MQEIDLKHKELFSTKNRIQIQVGFKVLAGPFSSIFLHSSHCSVFYGVHSMVNRVIESEEIVLLVLLKDKTL
jgi:hypothetical protein